MDIKKMLGKKYNKDMTTEELISALNAIEEPKDYSEENEELKTKIEELETRNSKLEKAKTKANHEAAESKRKYNALKNGEEEDDEPVKDQHVLDLEEKIKELETEKELNSLKSRFVEMGMDDKTATATAKAYQTGDTEKYFKNLNSHMETAKATALSDAVKNTPEPEGGSNKTAMTVDEIMAISDPIERQDAIAENIDLF